MEDLDRARPDSDAVGIESHALRGLQTTKKGADPKVGP